jgi:hypothetical protein
MHLRIRLLLLTCALFLGARSMPALPPPTPPPLLTTTPPAQPTVPTPPPWQPAPQATPPAITTPSPVPTAPPATVKQIHFGPAATVVLPTVESAVIYSINGIFQLVGLPQDQITSPFSILRAKSHKL